MAQEQSGTPRFRSFPRAGRCSTPTAAPWRSACVQQRLSCWATWSAMRIAPTRSPPRSARSWTYPGGPAARHHRPQEQPRRWCSRAPCRRRWREQVQQLGLPGVYLDKEPVRQYPEGSLAAQILGFVGQRLLGPRRRRTELQPGARRARPAPSTRRKTPPDRRSLSGGGC